MREQLKPLNVIRPSKQTMDVITIKEYIWDIYIYKIKVIWATWAI